MRHLLLVMIPVGAANSSGCASDCGAPQQLNGQVFSVFVNEVERLKAEGIEAFTAAPDFVSYNTPANGASDWEITWGAAALGPITVTIDGQPFDGEGFFDETECGQLEVDFGGTYVSERGSTHAFGAFGELVFDEGALRGDLEWNERWSTEDDTSGSYHAIVAVRPRE